ncbi:hypothetical protein (plasmid) [Staphylococcus aureus]|nr:ATP-binding cassette transporter [Staphylococcus aureus]
MIFSTKSELFKSFIALVIFINCFVVDLILKTRGYFCTFYHNSLLKILSNAIIILTINGYLDLDNYICVPLYYKEFNTDKVYDYWLNG